MSSATAEERAASYVGKVVGKRYRLFSLLGLGGMSSVFRGVDPEGQAVAVKILFPELLSGEGEQRFERESKLVLGLNHPHIVPTIDAGLDENLGAHFLVMPLLNGRDLDGILEEEGALEPESAVRIALQAARGLAAAHRIGIVHRDMKPGNLLVERDDAELVVKVCDFGIAKQLDAGEDDMLTATGSRLGTPDYASPEQLRNAKACDERTDVWGLGATLYQMLCGAAPFSHIESVYELIAAILSDEVPHIQDRAPWIEPGLARVVHRALDRDPGRRFQTMDDLARALRPFSGGDELLDESRLSRTSAELRSYVAERADLDESLVEAPEPDSGVDGDKLRLVGKKLAARYRVRRLIGRGGMGSVYEVEDESGDALAAKVISAGMAGASPTALERFAREARTASNIKSDNVVRTLDTGTDEALGMPFIIMELLRGTELSSVLKKEGALEPQVCVRLVLQAAIGVADAHESGVIHRDIKPANLFLHAPEPGGPITVKVCDFGVAKRTRAGQGNAASHLSLTRTGGMIGSPMYMSPEQAKNAKAVDQRTDVWSLSVVLWEALSGQRLWGSPNSLGELIVAICTEPIPELDLIAPWIPPDLARVVHRGLERDPALRPESVRDFIAAISPFSAGSDRVAETELVAISEAARSVRPVKIQISQSAAAGIKNLARGGRGGASLPPQRAKHKSKQVPAVATSGAKLFLILLLLVLVGVLAAALGYLLAKG
ncbi:MAG TPA: serine/threonine-protein kinase [Polyangiaceae bacterium]|nr:serine/threonine-protein kinase [Polyangiaceae bacterium]